MFSLSRKFRSCCCFGCHANNFEILQIFNRRSEFSRIIYSVGARLVMLGDSQLPSSSVALCLLLSRIKYVPHNLPCFLHVELVRQRVTGAFTDACSIMRNMISKSRSVIWDMCCLFINFRKARQKHDYPIWVGANDSWLNVYL